MNQITSVQNPKIKFLNQLKEKSRSRKKEGQFVVEGIREITLAIKGGYTVVQLFYCPKILDSTTIQSIQELSKTKITVFEVTSEVYDKIAYRSSTEGVLGLVKSRDLGIQNLVLKNKNPLILVAEAPEKPGNIGAILRTADAAKLDAILIANPRTDMYNPNIIRSSVGCVFTNNIGTGSTSEIISFLKEHDINTYGAALQASVNYCSQDYTKPTAIIVGTEDQGLSDEWLAATNQNIVIPMSGIIDSMNVSVAAGILIFEAKRQRGF